MMLITVSEKHSPAPPRKSGTVITDTGQKLDCWPDKLIAIQVGRQYEVETSTNARGFTSITKVTPVNGAAPSPPAPRESEATAAPTALSREEEFVKDVLCAYIANGRCEPAKLSEIIGYIRAGYQDHFGEPHKEAAQ